MKASDGSPLLFPDATLPGAGPPADYSALVWTGGHPGWVFDDRLLDRLVAEHPGARLTAARHGVRDLELTGGRVEVEVMDTGESVAVCGALAPVSELVVRLRRLVPDHIGLLLFDAEYTFDAVPLVPGATPGAVTELLQHGPESPDSW